MQIANINFTNVFILNVSTRGACMCAHTRTLHRYYASMHAYLKYVVFSLFARLCSQNEVALISLSQ